MVALSRNQLYDVGVEESKYARAEIELVTAELALLCGCRAIGVLVIYAIVSQVRQ